MAFTEDMTEFFDTDDFAVVATITGIGEVDGIYERQLVEIDGGISGWRPVFICAASSVTSAAIGTSLTVAGVTGTFTVAQIVTNDDLPVTTLVLEK